MLGFKPNQKIFAFSQSHNFFFFLNFAGMPLIDLFLLVCAGENGGNNDFFIFPNLFRNLQSQISANALNVKIRWAYHAVSQLSFLS